MCGTYMKIQPRLYLDNTSRDQDQVVSLFYMTVSPIAVHKFPSDSTSAQWYSSAFTYSMHLLYFSITFLIHTFCLLCSYSATHTKRAWWPWFLCSCFMTPCLELPAPLSMCNRRAPPPLLCSWYNTAALTSLFLPSSMRSSFALCKCLLAAHKQ